MEKKEQEKKHRAVIGETRENRKVDKKGKIKKERKQGIYEGRKRGRRDKSR